MTAESIVYAIVAALSAGLATGATDTAKKSIADAYDGLKHLIKTKVALLSLRTGIAFGLVAIAVGRYPSLRQRANQRRWRFVGGDPRFGVAQVLLGGLAGIGAARAGLWVLAVAFAVYVVSIFWGELLWKRSLSP